MRQPSEFQLLAREVEIFARNLLCWLANQSHFGSFVHTNEKVSKQVGKGLWRHAQSTVDGVHLTDQRMVHFGRCEQALEAD